MRTNSPADRLAQHTFGRSVVIMGSLDWPDEPVFHAHGDGNERVDEPTVQGWKRRTVCGRVVYEASWRRNLAGQTIEGSYKSSDRATNVHIVHAIRFARPCRQCFPDEAR